MIFSTKILENRTVKKENEPVRLGNKCILIRVESENLNRFSQNHPRSNL